jgi:hypothetical protein
MLVNNSMNPDFEQEVNPSEEQQVNSLEEQQVNSLEEQQNQKTLVPPAAANTLGNSKPVFDPRFAEKAMAINGTEEQRQTGAAGKNAPMFDIDNPKYKNAL